MNPAETEITLSPVLPGAVAPTWPEARWVGELDYHRPPETRYCLEGSEGYSWARLLVRDGRRLLGFAEVPITDGVLDPIVLHRALADLSAEPLSSAPSPRTGDEPGLRSVTVVVCTRDRAEMLEVALRSILTGSHPRFDVVVVDNAPSTDATLQCVTDLADSRVRVVTEPAPGLSRARNRGLMSTDSDIVAFTDDDVVVDPNWLTELVAGFDAADDVACVCGIVPSGELRTPAQMYFDQRVGWARSCRDRTYSMDSPPEDVPLFPFQVGIFGTGANFAVDRRTITRLGGFDEGLGAGSPTAGGEDLDMFFRVLDAGHRLRYQPSAVVWHRHRDENSALAAQSRGYGLGLGAWLTKIALDRRTARRAVHTTIVNARTFLALSRRMSRDARPKAELSPLLPPGVGTIELLSILRGPAAYARARRQGRSATPLQSLR
ncbi:glycosyltransferase family 2 protein [Rhodococcus sp. O3]|uniref:glycosyltransferase family 2 protein n=1 Tax=Rhodococcus sp. O3 TaxID=3404919 RepID=UPI003B672F89